MEKIDKHYEYLAKLYLRLKGYVVSNLIIHSEQKGYSKTELDIIGVRMPFHTQEDRQVNVVDYLECSMDQIEIIFGDVKNFNKVRDLKFNEGLRTNNESIKKLIKWIGCFENVSSELIKRFEEHLNLHRKFDWNGFAEFSEGSAIGKINFKFTFFCPSLPKWEGKGFKYIDGEEMVDFIWECLNKEKIVDTCSRTYPYESWNELERYVRFFKETETKVTVADFETAFNNK